MEHHPSEECEQNDQLIFSHVCCLNVSTLRLYAIIFVCLLLLCLLNVIVPFSAILQEFQIMRREFCVFCLEPLQPTQGSWLVPLEPPKSPKRGPF